MAVAHQKLPGWQVGGCEESVRHRHLLSWFQCLIVRLQKKHQCQIQGLRSGIAQAQCDNDITLQPVR